MEKINRKAACKLMSQGEFCEVMQLLKDMGINPKTPDGHFKKFSTVMDEISKYFNTNSNQYSNNIRENMRDVFPKEG